MRCQNEDQFTAFVSEIKKIMDNDDPLWSKIAVRIVINAVSHPIEYAKVLIQIGYEPIAPKPTTRLFGQPALGLPNVFQYIKYIKSIDGLTGCYRGLTPKICASTVYTIAFEKTVKSIKFKNGCEGDENLNIDELDDAERDQKYIQNFYKSLVGQTVAIILCHPFDVISVRMMAQFVGRETNYVTILGSVAEIYRANGISGYFSGIVPKLIAHISSLVIVTTTMYAVNKHVTKDRDMKTYIGSFVSFLASTITYPLLVVSQCMAVNNCGLIAGKPPSMPIYRDWTNCWSHLSKTKQLKRGSSLIWRYYTGSYVIINGKPIVQDTY